MFSGHYNDWRDRRVAFVADAVDPAAVLAGKRVLELGCGHAHVGDLFREKFGAVVTSADARAEHIEAARRLHPKIAAFEQIDCDADGSIPRGRFDAVVDWGLLYHLRDPAMHIRNVCESTGHILFLETEVCDSDDPDAVVATTESGYDQAFHNVGCRPSAAFVERELTKHGFSFALFRDSRLNAGLHVYDWPVANTKTWRHGQRRFWICWRASLPCPLRRETTAVR
jgi:SAM-dependent methyltransferase